MGASTLATLATASLAALSTAAPILPKHLGEASTFATSFESGASDVKPPVSAQSANAPTIGEDASRNNHGVVVYRTQESDDTNQGVYVEQQTVELPAESAHEGGSAGVSQHSNGGDGDDTVPIYAAADVKTLAEPAGQARPDDGTPTAPVHPGDAKEIELLRREDGQGKSDDGSWKLATGLSLGLGVSFVGAVSGYVYYNTKKGQELQSNVIV